MLVLKSYIYLFYTWFDRGGYDFCEEVRFSACYIYYPGCRFFKKKVDYRIPNEIYCEV